jgi:Transposase DDE domain
MRRDTWMRASNERAVRLGQGGLSSSILPFYARRNVVERCINRLKQWRSLATRYEKRVLNDRAMVVLTSVVLWL